MNDLPKYRGVAAHLKYEHYLKIEALAERHKITKSKVVRLIIESYFKTPETPDMINLD